MTRIESRTKWNKTPYQLSKDKCYRFIATGTWIDWYIATDAKGYESNFLKPLEKFRRYPQAKWFSLIGAIDKDKSTLFDIGHLIENNETYIATANGTLYCFANDVPIAYWNNKGFITLKVEEC